MCFHPQSSCWMHALFLFSSHLYTVSSVLHASVSVSRSAPSKGAETCTSAYFTGSYFRHLCPCLHVYGLSCSRISLCLVVVCVTEQVNLTMWPLGACSPAASDTLHSGLFFQLCTWQNIFRHDITVSLICIN